MGSSSLRHVFLTLVLVVASCQCSMICAVDPCGNYHSSLQDEGQLPCHQHQEPAQSSHAPGGCLHTPFVLDHPAPTPTSPEFVTVLSTPIATAEMHLFVPFDARQSGIAFETPPPL